MVRKLEQYRFRDGQTPLSEKELNARVFDIDSRIHSLEILSISWKEAVATVQNEGIKRINELIVPILAEGRRILIDIETDYVGKKEMQEAWFASLKTEWDLIEASWNAIRDHTHDGSTITGTVGNAAKLGGFSPSSVGGANVIPVSEANGKLAGSFLPEIGTSWGAM